MWNKNTAPERIIMHGTLLAGAIIGAGEWSFWAPAVPASANAAPRAAKRISRCRFIVLASLPRGIAAGRC